MHEKQHANRGRDFFDKYAPVVLWSSIQMLMILMTQEKLVMWLVDFTNVFIQATLKEDVYIKLAKLFHSPDGFNTVLKFNKFLYDFVQAPLL